MRVKNDFFFVCIFQRFAAFDLIRHTCGYNGCGTSESWKIAAQQVHHDSLSNVVSIVTCDDVFDAQLCRTSVEGLTSKYSTVGAIAFLPYLSHNLIHCPAVELVISHDLKRHAILGCIPLHRLEAVISIALDALVDGEKDKIQAIVVSFIQSLQDRGENGRIFSTRGPDGDAFSSVK